jgi:hypothetical protein
MVSKAAEELVLFWKRKDGVRCVALKRPATTAKSKRWEVRVVRASRVIKSEVFDTFLAAMRAAESWRGDFAVA